MARTFADARDAARFLVDAGYAITPQGGLFVPPSHRIKPLERQAAALAAMRFDLPPLEYKYQLSDEEDELVIEASRPRLLTMADQRVPQDLANEAWGQIAKALDVVFDTIRHESGDPGFVVTAIPQQRP